MEKRRGFTLIELIVAIAVSIIITLILYYSIRNSSLFFKENKIISDLIEVYRTTEIQLKYYFDRWGIAVPENPDNTDCSYTFSMNVSDSEFPKSKYCLEITNNDYNNSGITCDKVSFYIGTPGYIVVLHKCTLSTGACVVYCSVNDDPSSPYYYENFYATYACAMKNDETYYYIWRAGKIIDITRGNKLGVYGGWCGVEGDVPNACLGYVIPDADGNWDILLNEGDMIFRVPKKVTMYCKYNNELRGVYLYIDEDEVYEGSGDTAEEPYPIARVKGVKVTPYPSGCDAISGGCKGIIMRIKFTDDNDTHVFEKELILGR